MENDTPKGRDFGWALFHLYEGSQVKRVGWDGSYIQLVVDGVNYRPCIEFTKGQGYAAWDPKQEDILAEDWVIYGE